MAGMIKMGDWRGDINKTFQGFDKVVADRLCWIGEQALTIAREKGKANDYGDRTGNLRSSIGYIVLKDGHAIESGGFVHTQAKDGDGSKGMEEGKSLLQMLRAEYPKGYVLIMCAGMEYASYVENIHGRDVLTSARLKAEQLAQNFINKINQ